VSEKALRLPAAPVPGPAPGLFRRDAVFRYAVVGGGLALLALLSRLGDAPVPVPAPASALPPVAKASRRPCAPASLGTEYGAAPESKRPPEPVSHDPPASLRVTVSMSWAQREILARRPIASA